MKNGVHKDAAATGYFITFDASTASLLSMPMSGIL